MPYINYRKNIVITNVGGNLQQDVAEPVDTYYVSGSATMIGNLQITPSGTPATGLTFFFIWKANLDIVTNSTTVIVFGKALTAVQVTKLNYITASYNGSSWDVDVQTSDGNTAFIENFQLGANIVQASNLANGAIGSTQIANGSVTLNKLATDSVDSSKIVDGSIVTADLADDSVITSKIVDLNVTTAKINDLAVTTGKINTDAVTTAKILDYNVTANKIGSNAVTTAKILDANVTTAKVADGAIINTKLAIMTPSSIKTGDSSGNPTDLFIGLDQIPIGNGTSVTVTNAATILGNSWKTLGNAGTTPGTNFIGTTDAQDLVFKTNSIESGRINLSDGNTSFGVESLLNTTIGSANTAFGEESLKNNNSDANSSFGVFSLRNNTSGLGNSAFGYHALDTNTIGDKNTAVGNSAGNTIIDGSFNTCIGGSSDSSLSTGVNRIALGYNAIATEDYQFALPDNVTKIKWRGTSYVLPATDGTIGQKLTTDGAGNLSWT